MKRLFSLLLALVMCLSLCACGNTNNAQENSTPEVSPTEPVEEVNEEEVSSTEPVEEVNEENILYLNKTENVGDYAFTITGTEFTHTRTLGNTKYSAGDGNVYLILYFNIKNIGKTEVSPTISCDVEYADGYIFSENFSMLSMAPLSEASDNSIAIKVPEVIENDYASDLKIVVKGKPLGVEENYTYYLSPMNDEQKEAVYGKAVFLMNNGFYDEAYNYFMRCGDYKDSVDMATKVTEYIDIVNHPGSYVEKLGEYRAVLGDEISSLLLGGNFMMSKTGEYWTFEKDNILYDTYCNDNPFMNQYASWGFGNFQPTWSVENDKLVVVGLNGNGKKVKTAFTVSEVGSGIYLLYTDSTEVLVGDLMYGDGTGLYSLYKKGSAEERFVLN